MSSNLKAALAAGVILCTASVAQGATYTAPGGWDRDTVRAVFQTLGPSEVRRLARSGEFSISGSKIGTLTFGDLFPNGVVRPNRGQLFRIRAAIAAKIGNRGAPDVAVTPVPATLLLMLTGLGGLLVLRRRQGSA